MAYRSTTPYRRDHHTVDEWDYENTSETDDPSFVVDLKLLSESKNLKELIRSKEIYLHASGFAFWPAHTQFPATAMKVLLQSLHPCAYFQQTTFIGQVCAAFFKVVVSQSGYGFEYCKDETYANDVPARPDGYRGYVEAYRDYEIRAQDYQRKVHIAVITHPEYRSLMKMADISIVLCTLPPDYDKYKQIHIPHDVPAWAVFYKVQEMVAEARAVVEAGDQLENLKGVLNEFRPFMRIKGKDTDVKDEAKQ